MKYLVNILLVVFFAQSLVAQPTITHQIEPKIGDISTITFMEIDNFNLGGSGANQIWDFSALNISSAFDITVQILDQDDITGGNTYPEVDFVWNLKEFEIYNYYKIDQDSLTLLAGASISNGLIDFETIFVNPEDGLHFPLTFGDEYDYYSLFEQKVFGMNLGTNERHGSVVADAYGKLITPKGTFENVLRLKITETSFGFTSTQYAWYDVNEFVPLFLYEDSNDPDITPSLYFSNPSIINSVSSNETSNNWKAWYDIDEMAVIIDINDLEVKDHLQFDIYSLGGKLVASENQKIGSKQQTIQLPSSVQPGVIIISVDNGKQLTSKKILVNRS